ncbi:hypothetical protein Bca4012_009410 [Brassica carinata]
MVLNPYKLKLIPGQHDQCNILPLGSITDVDMAMDIEEVLDKHYNESGRVGAVGELDIQIFFGEFSASL